MLQNPGQDDCAQSVVSVSQQNYEFYCYFCSQIAALRIESGYMALQLLTSSERVYEDLTRVIRVKDSRPWNVKVDFLVAEDDKLDSGTGMD